VAGVVLVKIWFSRRMARSSDEVRSTALGVEAMHHWSDAITSAAAFVGISIDMRGGDARLFDVDAGVDGFAYQMRAIEQQPHAARVRSIRQITKGAHDRILAAGDGLHRRGAVSPSYAKV
jgi:hypothetical protein